PCEPSHDCSRLDPHHPGPPDPPPPPPRQRTPTSPDQDAFHRRVLPTPSSTLSRVLRACALRDGITRRPSPAGPKPCLRRTGLAARVLVAFTTASRLRRRFTCRASPEGGLAG